jgi:hypothetical protein
MTSTETGLVGGHDRVTMPEALVGKGIQRPLDVGGRCFDGYMTVTATPETRPEAPAEVLRAARDRRRSADAAEADLLCLAVEWAAMHPPESIHGEAVLRLRTFGETDLAIAGPGAPTVAEFCVAEFASAVGLSTEAGKRFLGESIELRHRLPRLWARVTDGDLPAWKARMVARETVRLSPDAAAYVDRHVAPVAHKVRPVELERLVAESWDKRHVTIHDQLVSFTGTMRVEAELDIADALDFEAAVAVGADERAAWGSTEPLDVRRAQAVGDLARRQAALDFSAADASPRARKARQVVLHVHLSEAAMVGDDPVAHLERGNSVVSVEQVRTWCGHPDAQVVVKPLLDLARCVEVDSDLVPDRVAEQVALRDRTCVFPWCTRPARRCRPDDHSCDADHVRPRSRGGPTCSCNLASLCRRHHRLKTHSPWTYLVVDPGSYLWTSPHGYQFLRDRSGTVDVSPERPDARAHPPHP